MDELRQMQIVNDEVARVPIVLIASPISDAVRVYNRGKYQFEDSLEGVAGIVNQDVWTLFKIIPSIQLLEWQSGE